MEHSRNFLKSNDIYLNTKSSTWLSTHNRGRICHLHNAFAINGCLICVISIVNQGQYIYIYIACANIIISRYARHARANWIMKIIANTLIFLITMFWRKCYAFVQVHLSCAKHYLYSFYTIANKYIGRYRHKPKNRLKI